MHPLLNGSGSWNDSGNWRDAIKTADLAVRYLLPIAEDEARLDQADFRTLAEIGAAASFLRELPSQMRGNSCDQLIRLLKGASTGPKRGLVRGLIGFAVNPLGTSISVAANQLGKHMLSDDDALTHFTSFVEATVVDFQLEYVWTHASEFPYDSGFDQEAGRRAYWLAFIWNEQNHLGRFPSDFHLTPDEANQALQRSKSEVLDIRSNPDRLAQIWCNSPLFATNDVVGSISRANELNKVARKLAKGKTIPEVEQALNHHLALIELRERHIHGYAIRMRWTGA